MTLLGRRRHAGLAGGPETLWWWRAPSPSRGHGYVAYRGWLGTPAGLRLHYGFDGWEGRRREAHLESVGDGIAVAAVPDLDDHVTIDAVITDGDQWDDNYGCDYRLWIPFTPVDSHVHASRRGMGERGSDSLHVALRSAGIRTAVVSWRDNRFVDWLVSVMPQLHPLVWVRPRHTRLDDVAARLDKGHVGLKLHPSFDRFDADATFVDPYIRVASEAGCPVAVHSAAGRSDPGRIRNLAERFPTVQFVLYHTYLGPAEGRHRATAHALDTPNLHLETSWCGSDEVRRIVDTVGPDRVLFGSDAAVDGERHYVRQPPNIEGRDTYNGSLVHLVRALGTDVARTIMVDNTRRLFRLPDDSPDDSADEEARHVPA